MRKQKLESPIQSILLGNIMSFSIVILLIFHLPPLNIPIEATLLIMVGIFQLHSSYIPYFEELKTITTLSSILITVIVPISNLT